ncbi:MAG: tyrosine-type recombinase/integrase [Pseudomonadota bacterium]
MTEHLSKRRAQRLCEDVRTAINAREFVQHGWRYNAGKELADAGVSDADVQAVTGHKTTAMAQKYRAQANQREASRRAQQKRERNNHRT